MSRYQLLFFTFLLFSFQIVAQNQHLNWYFGSQAGLNFSSGNPVALQNSQIETQESCASMSDAAGNLLFYTNGMTVWNANHSIMPNGTGLLGNPSSFCIAIPKPNSPNIYYIIVADASHSSPSNGLTYSEVDLTLNGGLGDITTLKNISLNIENGEWITAVPHANCIDTWVVTHGRNGNSNFLAFLVTENGVSTTPVSTNIGFTVPSGITEGIGSMRPNRTGNLIAMTLPHFNGGLELITFNQSTGIPTGVEELYSASSFLDKPYGIEFSRSGNILYTGDFDGNLFQYDMTAASIASTRTFIGGLSIAGELGQLQLAPNNKIYVNTNDYSMTGATSLGVINNPEVLGTGCSYQPSGVSLGGHSSFYGLPWHYNPITSNNQLTNLGNDTLLCQGANLELSSTNALPGTTFLWSDGSTTPSINVTTEGIYWLTTQNGGCAPSTDSILIQLDTTIINHNILDTVGCAPLSLPFVASTTNVFNWNWDFGDNSGAQSSSVTHTYSSSGNYTVTLNGTSVFGCPLICTDSIQVTVHALPIANFNYSPSADIHIDEELFFTDQSNGAIVSWNWEMGDNTFYQTNEFLHAFQSSGSFPVTLTITDSNGCESEIVKTIIILGENLVYVPNSFSPNGDGINDYFQAIDVDGSVHHFAIYNRWGEIVWERQNATDSWDGTYKGEHVPNDVYTWEIKTVINEIPNSVFQGHVTLVR